MVSLQSLPPEIIAQIVQEVYDAGPLRSAQMQAMLTMQNTGAMGVAIMNMVFNIEGDTGDIPTEANPLASIFQNLQRSLEENGEMPPPSTETQEPQTVVQPPVTRPVLSNFMTMFNLAPHDFRQSTSARQSIPEIYAGLPKPKTSVDPDVQAEFSVKEGKNKLNLNGKGKMKNISPTQNRSMPDVGSSRLNVEQDEKDFWTDEDSDMELELQVRPPTYPDGLPKEHALPLALISRVFLHTARRRLYRNIRISSTWRAFLLFNSLSAPKHAAYTPAESLDYLEQKKKNHLPLLIRSLIIHVEDHDGILGSASGATHLLKLVGLCTEATHVEIRNGFVNSLTPLFLSSVSNLKGLKKFIFKAPVSKESPLIMTIPRLFMLQQKSWPNLEELCINNLKKGSHGLPSEEHEMWIMREKLDSEKRDRNKNSSASTSAAAGYTKAERPGLVKPATERTIPKGLTTLTLTHADVSYHDLMLILRDTKQLSRLFLPYFSNELTRLGLTNLLLNFSNSLTHLCLVPDDWSLPSDENEYPVLPEGMSRANLTPSHRTAISEYIYFLDAILPFLPQLDSIEWDGPLASTKVFEYFPPKLRCVTAGPSQVLDVKTISRILKRMSTSKEKRAAPGLKCLTFMPPNNMPEIDYQELVKVTRARNICVHIEN